MKSAKVTMCVMVLLLSDLFPLAAKASSHTAVQSPTIVVQWNNAALQGVRDSKIGPPMAARALAIVHTCMYDAWALYDDRAIPTQLSSEFRPPLNERTDWNRLEAISYAAYRAVVDLFALDDASVFRPLMTQLGYDPDDVSTNTSTPVGIGNAACNAVLAFRHADGANQLGDLSATSTPYADYTGYTAVNPPSTVPVDPKSIIDPSHWQPLQYRNASKTLVTQTFVGTQWERVIPFALSSHDEFRNEIAERGPAPYGSAEYFDQAEELVRFSAGLTDRQKMIAEYWKDGPNSETPPGHWCLFAQFVSSRDHHGISDDIKLFFALTNAEFDASIAAWDAKRAFDSIRPVSAVPYLFHGQQIRAWGGPGKGTVTMDGASWIPYQPATLPTPPFPEYISGHSTFSAAGATILRLFTGSDCFEDSVTFAAGSSSLEPGITPASAVTLEWPTFTAAADEAGISRRYGGIHFKSGDLTGRATGRAVALQAWEKAKFLWNRSECRDCDHAGH